MQLRRWTEKDSNGNDVMHYYIVQFKDSSSYDKLSRTNYTSNANYPTGKQYRDGAYCRDSDDAFPSKTEITLNVETEITKEVYDKLLTKCFDNSELSKQEPEYIRVLGTTETGFSLINKIKELSALKIITKVADFKDENKMFEKDILATDIFDLSSSSPQGAGRDFKTTPIILRSTT
jgi:hypothetical protein